MTIMPMFIVYIISKLGFIYKVVKKYNKKIERKFLYMTMNARITGSTASEIEEMITWLASFGDSGEGGVTRLLYTRPWLDAQHALKEKMEGWGMDAYFDDSGNLFGRIEGTETQQKAILTGSHIDTVTNGGRLDGAYGILAGLLAAKRLREAYGAPKRPIEVVSLCEEEGSRFPLTFWGSGNLTGLFDCTKAPAVCDRDGISIEQAMKQCGFGEGRYKKPFRNDAACFIELHIEQGGILEASGRQIGIVTDIVGQRRYTVTVKGESNHAGTTPMNTRKDAVAISSLCISYLTKKARAADPLLTATVGRLEAKPNVPNVISGEAVFSLDLRHHSEAVLDRFGEDIFRYFTELSEESGVQISAVQTTDAKPVKMDRELTRLSKRAAEKTNVSYREMVSGAGHDAQIFGTHCPTTLLFVPSRNGISHSPEEWTNPDDLNSGIRLLANLLYTLAYE